MDKVSAAKSLRASLCLSACLAIFAGCGGSLPPFGAPGAMPQGATTQASAHQATRGALIYAVGGCGGVCVLSYPQGKLVAAFNPGGQIGSDCADNAGNVFIPNDDKVLKYAHGDTAPTGTLSLPGSHALACAVDPTTGNLAVIFSGNGLDIAVFPDASGSPTLYNAHNLPAYCGYDGSGDLFVDGIEGTGKYALSVLPSGGSDFSKLSLPQSVGLPGQVQWDGTYITYESLLQEHEMISQLQVSGSSVSVVNTIHLSGIDRRAAPSWIYKGSVVVPYSDHGVFARNIGIWPYPNGGGPSKKISKFRGYKKKSFGFEGVTVSVATSR